MHVVSFPCPHCVIPLRVKDRGFVGRTISCPECHRPVTIADDGQGLLVGRPAEDANTSAVKSRSAWRGMTRLTPTMIGWVVAGCLVVTLGLFLILPTLRRPAASVAAEPAEGDEPANRPELGRPSAADVAAKPTTIEHRLDALHKVIAPSPDPGSAFPVGTVAADGLPVAQRFSWIASLAAANDPDAPQAQWDRRWNDPANERFVRRQLPQWLNPAVESVVGEHRYPTTHFVGVAGVGVDAASLPVDHPRAGIFGNDRRVRAEDVGDGLANTMLIAGVEERLGSWAAGGEARVRGFTAEPYLHGPDGFGTGEADGMHMLMADGSVKFLSRDVAPTIIRRMASMNDRLPLDPTIPGEPRSRTERPIMAQRRAGDVSPLTAGNGTAVNAPDEPPPANDLETDDAADPRIADAAAVIAGLAGPQEVPIDVLMAEPLPVYDVEAALAQPIVEFQQKEPVPIRDLLRLIEEMAAVPIDDSDLPSGAADALDQPITLTLSDTTVGDILEAVLRSAGLTSDARPEGIYIRREDAPVE